MEAQIKALPSASTEYLAAALKREGWVLEEDRFNTWNSETWLFPHPILPVHRVLI
jgi:hypothetical protein